MAFTERYVTAAAGGGGAGTSGDPWTLAEAFSTAAAGDRVNILKGAYSTGSVTLSNSGTFASGIVYRGYNSTIGDLAGPRNNDGTGPITTANYPVITVTGNIVPGNLTVFESMAFTGSIGDWLLDGPTSDNNTLISCAFTNTGSGGGCVRLGNECSVNNSDFTCTDSAHAIVVDIGVSAMAYGCRFDSAEDTCLRINDGTVVRNTFLGAGAGGTTVGVELETWGRPLQVISNTFNDLLKAVQLPNTSPAGHINVFDNHATNCGQFIDSLYAGTDDAPVILGHNRTRDITSASDGVGDWPDFGGVTATGGKGATDYFNEPGDDFRLLPGAPGVGMALVGGHLDIGALQHRDPYNPRARRH